MAALVVGVATPSLAVHRFGDQPYTHLRQAAENYASGCQLATKDRISARMLSITWSEVTNEDGSYNPSPMTLSRGDNDAGLWWSGNRDPNSDRARVFWHPGIGTWQMDDIGLGSDFGATRFSSNAMADEVAKTIRGRICSGSAVYAAWYGCDDGSCQDDFDQIFSGGNLGNIDNSANIDTWGGTKTRECEEWVPPGRPDPPNFTCRYVKFGSAEGYTGSWVYTPYSGNGCADCTSPLAFPFYVYNFKNANDKWVEARVWVEQDTGLNTTLTMKREFGKNSRTTLNYDAGEGGLCDLDRGICSYN